MDFSAVRARLVVWAAEWTGATTPAHPWGEEGPLQLPPRPKSGIGIDPEGADRDCRNVILFLRGRRDLRRLARLSPPIPPSNAMGSEYEVARGPSVAHDKVEEVVFRS